MKKSLLFLVIAMFIISSKAFAFNYFLPQTCSYARAMTDLDKMVAVQCLVSVGIGASYANDFATNGPPGSYPASLDSASDGLCEASNPCFTNVTRRGVIDGLWEKSGDVYTNSTTGIECTYTNTSGSFICDCPSGEYWDTTTFTCIP